MFSLFFVLCPKRTIRSVRRVLMCLERQERSMKESGGLSSGVICFEKRGMKKESEGLVCRGKGVH